MGHDWIFFFFFFFFFLFFLSFFLIDGILQFQKIDQIFFKVARLLLCHCYLVFKPFRYFYHALSTFAQK